MNTGHRKLSALLLCIILVFLIGVIGVIVYGKTASTTCHNLGLQLSVGCAKALFSFHNQVNNSLLHWSNGWYNKQSKISGSEVNFTMTGGESMIVSSIFSSNDPSQKLYIVIESEAYTLKPAANKTGLIYIHNPKKFDSTNIKIWHFCTYKKNCDVKIHALYLQRSTKIVKQTSQSKIMVFFGDSISKLYDKDNYAYKVAAATKHIPIIESVYGSTVSPSMPLDYSYNRHSLITPYKANVIFVFLGTNDVGYGISKPTFTAHYARLVQAIRKNNHGSKIFVVGMLDRKDIDVAGYNESVKRIARESHSNYIDTTGWITDKDLVDDVHPDRDSQQKIAEKLIKALKL